MMKKGLVIAATLALCAACGGKHAKSPGARIELDGTAETGIAPLTEQLDATGSSCVNWCASFDWDFGDGSDHLGGAWVSHVYQKDGTYTVTLSVSDGQTGEVSTATMDITANVGK